jgi:dimethylhistidine N-methyltransferase
LQWPARLYTLAPTRCSSGTGRLATSPIQGDAGAEIAARADRVQLIEIVRPDKARRDEAMDDVHYPEALVAFVDLDPEIEDFRSAVIDGLSGPQKTLPCKFFYDERGSWLFDRICTLEEYYPTRTEIRILEERIGEIAELIGRRAHLIELGSGASVKIRSLLNALPDLVQYTAVDISREHLLKSAEALALDYPALNVAAVCADYTGAFDVPNPAHYPGAHRVAFFPGSTIGNFSHDEAVAFLTRIAGILGSGGGLLIGADLRKDHDVLHAAYNDAEGITADFNLNLLHRINAELGGDFDVDAFEHSAVYLEDPGRIEMRLVSTRRQAASVGGHRFEFARGEYIHTENSHKFGIDEFRGICARAGFTPVACWTDADQLFSVHYFSIE